LEKENDPNDDIVDYNGHTNRGYGSEVPKDYFNKNHIMPGSHITVPRDDSNPPLGNSLINLRVTPTNSFIQFSQDIDVANV